MSGEPFSSAAINVFYLIITFFNINWAPNLTSSSSSSSSFSILTTSPSSSREGAFLLPILLFSPLPFCLFFYLASGCFSLTSSVGSVLFLVFSTKQSVIVTRRSEIWLKNITLVVGKHLLKLLGMSDLQVLLQGAEVQVSLSALSHSALVLQTSYLNWQIECLMMRSYLPHFRGSGCAAWGWSLWRKSCRSICRGKDDRPCEAFGAWSGYLSTKTQIQL
jgi:hypothetical protein